MARNLTAADEGFLLGKRYLLMDRDSKFSAAFREMLADAGVKTVRLPPRSPNLNAHLERFWRSLREECLDGMIFFGEMALRRAVGEFVLHFHRERNHQGLDNRLIEPDLAVLLPFSSIDRPELTSLKSCLGRPPFAPTLAGTSDCGERSSGCLGRDYASYVQQISGDAASNARPSLLTIRVFGAA